MQKCDFGVSDVHPDGDAHRSPMETRAGHPWGRAQVTHGDMHGSLMGMCTGHRWGRAQVTDGDVHRSLMGTRTGHRQAPGTPVLLRV